MKKVILILFISAFFISNNYAYNNYEQFKTDINKRLTILSNFAQTFYENDMESFDPDSLSNAIAEDVAEYLRSGGLKYFNAQDFPLMEHVEKNNGSPFEVLIIGYHCGGTAGWIPHSIIIKHTNHKSLIYDIKAETYFYEFHRLKDEIYLCIGGAPGSGICRGYAVYSIDFGNEGSKFEPVFNGEHAFFLCNSDITFDEEDKMMTVYIDYLPYKDDDTSYETYLNENGYTYFSVEEDTEEGEQNFEIIFRSKFDGKRFVKP